MEILAHGFYLFWAAISAIFLKLAFNAIDNTVFSNSASPLSMLLFKHSSAVFTCYSANHAFYRFRMKEPIDSYLVLFANGIIILVILTGGSLLFCFVPIYAAINQYHLFIEASDDGRFSSKWKLVLYASYIIATAFVFVPVAFDPTSFNGHAKTFTMVAVTCQNIISIIVLKDGKFGSKRELVGYSLYVIIATGASASNFTFPASGWTNLEGNNIIYNYLLIISSSLILAPVLLCGLVNTSSEGESRPTTEPGHDPLILILNYNDDNYKYKIKKWAEFAVGLLGTILFQNFFRINSFEEVVGFLYFAVAWLANTTMLSASHDLGVFNFLLGNAIVGCSVSEFGLGRQTWIAYAACVFLYSLRLKTQSLSFVNTQHGNRKVILW